MQDLSPTSLWFIYLFPSRPGDITSLPVVFPFITAVKCSVSMSFIAECHFSMLRRVLSPPVFTHHCFSTPVVPYGSGNAHRFEVACPLCYDLQWRRLLAASDWRWIPSHVLNEQEKLSPRCLETRSVSSPAPFQLRVEPPYKDSILNTFLSASASVSLPLYTRHTYCTVFVF